jgi:hypothetical protein
MAQAEMMLGAAEGMKKGGGAGTGLEGAGIGMGFAMAGQFANMMNPNNNMGGGQRPGGQGAAPAAPPAETADQVMGKLKQLGELKAAAVHTDAEIKAKKKELLSRI